MQPTRRRLSGRTLAALVMLCAVPALIALGVTVFDDRKYYLISLLIIACTLVPFAVAFERRRLMAPVSSPPSAPRQTPATITRADTGLTWGAQ